MTLNQIATNEPITVRVYKTAGINLGWANTYELYATGPIEGNDVLTELQNLVDTIASFEASQLLSTYRVDRVVVSTWAPDGEPYNPTTFSVYPIGGAGQRSVLGLEPMPLEFCVFVKKEVNFGRAGHWLFRGCLVDTDVNVSGGRSMLTTARWDAFNDAVNDMLAALNTSIFRLALIGNTAQGLLARDVVNVVTSTQVRFKKLNNRYFDVP